MSDDRAAEYLGLQFEATRKGMALTMDNYAKDMEDHIKHATTSESKKQVDPWDEWLGKYFAHPSLFPCTRLTPRNRQTFGKQQPQISSSDILNGALTDFGIISISIYTSNYLRAISNIAFENGFYISDNTDFFTSWIERCSVPDDPIHSP